MRLADVEIHGIWRVVIEPLLPLAQSEDVFAAICSARPVLSYAIHFILLLPSVVLPLHPQPPHILLYKHHQILNRTDLYPPLLSKSQTLIPPHHATPAHLRLPRHNLPVRDQLANNAYRCLPRQPAQIDSRLRMPPSHANTTLPRLQRQYMPRSPELRRLCGGVREHATCEAPVVRADAGGYRGVSGIDGDGVGGLVGVRVFGYHLGEVEGGGARDGERGAEVA
jgi:hypothetical protein